MTQGTDMAPPGKAARWFFQLLVYAGLGFLLLYLLRFDYVDVSGLQPAWGALLLSFLLLFAGFVVSALCWWKALRLHGAEARPVEALVSHGLPVFAKYIPGKVWVVLGRASRAGRFTGHSLKSLSFVSLKEQVVYAWTGLLISLPLVLLWPLPAWGVWPVIALFVILGVAGFSDRFRRVFIWVVEKLGGQPPPIPAWKPGSHAALFAFSLLNWACWMLAFAFFVRAWAPGASLLAAFAFPPGVVLGLLALVLPGGMGVREGVLTALLHAMGHPLELAVTLAVLSRLWFVVGEVFLFVLASVLEIHGRRKAQSWPAAAHAPSTDSSTR